MSPGSIETYADPISMPRLSASCSAPAANDNVVRYALASATAPLAVADYTYDSLPPSIREAVPSTEQLEAAAAAAHGIITVQGNVGANAAASVNSGETPFADSQAVPDRGE